MGLGQTARHYWQPYPCRTAARPTRFPAVPIRCSASAREGPPFDVIANPTGAPQAGALVVAHGTARRAAQLVARRSRSPANNERGHGHRRGVIAAFAVQPHPLAGRSLHLGERGHASAIAAPSSRTHPWCFGTPAQLSRNSDSAANNDRDTLDASNQMCALPVVAQSTNGAGPWTRMNAETCRAARWSVAWE